MQEEIDYLSKIQHLPPEEKQKIIDVISSVDNLIKLHEDKIALLKKHRIGLLQKLVPDAFINKVNKKDMFWDL